MISETLCTGTPAFFKASLVPPVLKISMFSLVRPLAKSTSPALSETLRIARMSSLLFQEFGNPDGFWSTPCAPTLGGRRKEVLRDTLRLPAASLPSASPCLVCHSRGGGNPWKVANQKASALVSSSIYEDPGPALLLDYFTNGLGFRHRLLESADVLR